MLGKLSFVFGHLVDFLDKDLGYAPTLAGGPGRFKDNKDSSSPAATSPSGAAHSSNVVAPAPPANIAVAAASSLRSGFGALGKGFLSEMNTLKRHAQGIGSAAVAAVAAVVPIDALINKKKEQRGGGERRPLISAAPCVAVALHFPLPSLWTCSSSIET